MDAAGHPHIQGGSSSCRAADYAATRDAEQQQKRQRCQGSSENQVGSSTENNSLQASGSEFKVDNGENVEEDYYFDDEECGVYDDDEVESDYEIDTADFNQQLADKFDGLDLPPDVEATVSWLLKDPTDELGKFKSMKEIDDEIAKKYNFFKQFDTVEDFSDHHYANKSVGKPRKEWVKRIQHDWSLLEKDSPGQLSASAIVPPCCSNESLLSLTYGGQILVYGLGSKHESRTDS